MSEDQKPAAPPPQKFDFNSLIFELWNGGKPLAHVFWLYYFTVVLVLWVLSGTLGFLSGMFGMLQLIWAGFMVKPIWVAADSYEGPKHWALLAKGAAILIGLGVLGNALAFLA